MILVLSPPWGVRCPCSPRIWQYLTWTLGFLSLWVSDVGMDHFSDFSEPLDSGSRPGSPGSGKFLHVFSDVALPGGGKVECVDSTLQKRISFIFSPAGAQHGLSEYLEGKDHILFIFAFSASGTKPNK